MKLPSFVRRFKGKSTKKNYTFAILIGKENIGAGVWAGHRAEVEIVGSSSQSYDGGWDEAITAADMALANACSKLPEGKAIENVVFGLPPEYVDGDRIASQYLGELKRLCRELSLSAVGFVVIPEALAYYLARDEGTPPTVLLVSVEDETLSVTLFKVGNCVGTIVVPSTDSISADLEKALDGFAHVEVFPSRIILYGQEAILDRAREELLEHPWQSKPKFLHFPKIETVDRTEIIQAVISAGASELAKQAIPGRISSLAPSDEDELPLPSQEKKSTALETAIPASTSTQFGFVKEKDIALEDQTRTHETVTDAEKSGKADSTKPRFKMRIPHLTLPPMVRWRLPSYGFRLFLILGIFVVVLFGGIGLSLYWTIPAATLRLLVDAQILKRDFDVKLDTGATGSNESENKISASIVDAEVSSQKTAATSGKKIVGDPATGEVTVYNKTTNEKIFPKGTILTGPKNLQFTLTNEILVASVSDVIVGTPGKAKAKVTAVIIGSDSNLPASSDFTFKDLPVNLYAGRNEVAFTGGNSREVQVVSKTDQENIAKELINNLDKEIKDKLAAKLEAGKQLLPESIQTVVVKKAFSQEIGAEASQFEVQLSLKASGTAYKKDDLEALVRQNLASSVPANFILEANTPDIEVSDARVARDGSVTFTASVKAKLLPIITKDELKKQIVGKNLGDVEKILRASAGVVGYEVVFTQELPFVRRVMPNLAKNLQVEVHPR